METEDELGYKRYRKPKGQSRMYNPETLATLDTRHRTKTNNINVRENRRGNPDMCNPETLATLDTGRRQIT